MFDFSALLDVEIKCATDVDKLWRMCEYRIPMFLVDRVVINETKPRELRKQVLARAAYWATGENVYKQGMSDKEFDDYVAELRAIMSKRRK